MNLQSLEQWRVSVGQLERYINLILSVDMDMHIPSPKLVFRNDGMIRNGPSRLAAMVRKLLETAKASFGKRNRAKFGKTCRGVCAETTAHLPSTRFGA